MFKKQDSGKLRWGLMPFGALDDIARVFTYGASKYGDRNWEQCKGKEVDRLLAAAMRHLSKHMQGELYDPESGLRHISHAATNLLMYMELTSEQS